MSDLPDETRISVLLLFFGGFLIVFGLASYVIRGRFYLTTAPVALFCGVLLGPKGAGYVCRFSADSSLLILSGRWENASESDSSKENLLWFVRIVLGIQVLSTAVTLPKRVFTKPWIRQSLIVLLGPAMLSAVAITACLAKAFIPAIQWREAFVVGTCLAPTDPVLAASVVKGAFAEKHVPPFIRDLLLCEAGINDGAATPYLMIPLLALTSYTPVKDYVVETLLRETLLGIVGGFAVGTLARAAWDAADKRGWIDKESRLVWTIALGMFTTGLASTSAALTQFNLIDSNELLACYFCGTAINWNGHFHDEGIDALLDVATFATLGTILSWDKWRDASSSVTLWRLSAFGGGVLLLRRLPVVLLLKRIIPEIRSTREACFVGWFGPMGVGALYYALKSAEEAPEGSLLKHQLFTIISFVVALSTIVHGTTVTLSVLASSIHPSFHSKFLVEAEHTPLDEPQGEFITRAELDDILNGHGDEESLNSNQEQALVGDGSGLENWGRGRKTVYIEGSRLLLCDAEGNVSVRAIR